MSTYRACLILLSILWILSIHKSYAHDSTNESWNRLPSASSEELWDIHDPDFIRKVYERAENSNMTRSFRKTSAYLPSRLIETKCITQIGELSIENLVQDIQKIRAAMWPSHLIGPLTDRNLERQTAIHLREVGDGLAILDQENADKTPNEIRPLMGIHEGLMVLGYDDETGARSTALWQLEGAKSPQETASLLTEILPLFTDLKRDRSDPKAFHRQMAGGASVVGGAGDWHSLHLKAVLLRNGVPFLDFAGETFKAAGRKVSFDRDAILRKIRRIKIKTDYKVGENAPTLWDEKNQTFTLSAARWEKLLEIHDDKERNEALGTLLYEIYLPLIAEDIGTRSTP